MFALEMQLHSCCFFFVDWPMRSCPVELHCLCWNYSHANLKHQFLPNKAFLNRPQQILGPFWETEKVQDVQHFDCLRHSLIMLETND